jgi:hypothetical protein
VKFNVVLTFVEMTALAGVRGKRTGFRDIEHLGE